MADLLHQLLKMRSNESLMQFSPECIPVKEVEAETLGDSNYLGDGIVLTVLTV